jgi:hypothetical protein
MRQVVATSRALNKLDESAGKVVNMFNRLNTSDSKIETGLGSFIADGNVASLTNEEFTTMKDQGVESVIGNLTTEEMNALGKKKGELESELQAALNNAQE